MKITYAAAIAITIIIIVLFAFWRLTIGPSIDEPVFCAEDAKLCPDGSYVGRVPPSCNFRDCPSEIPKTDAVISYTDNGFVPAEIAVFSGDTVSFINQSSGVMRIVSDPHPVHSGYPEFDQIETVSAGGVYNFKFVKTGEWKYHNEADLEKTGMIRVN